MGGHTGTYKLCIHNFAQLQSQSYTYNWCCWPHEQESIHASSRYNSPWTMSSSIITHTSDPTAFLTASRTLSHVLGCFPVPSPLCNHFLNMVLQRFSTSLWSASTVSRTCGAMSSCNPTSSHFGDTLGTAYLTRSFSCKEPYSVQKSHSGQLYIAFVSIIMYTYIHISMNTLGLCDNQKNIITIFCDIIGKLSQ